jgi:hypothetical protein
MQRADSATEQPTASPPWALSHTPPRGRRRRAAVRRWVTLAVGVLLATAVSAGPAWAHGGGGGAPEGYVFVQQALGHLAHESGPRAVADAEASIGEALSATDQEGVDVAMVTQAKAELTAGQITAARQTLQQSITAAVTALTPATGEETGTTVVGEPLPGRGSLTGTDWTFGAVSLLLLAAGVGLALLFRPAQNLAQLRRGLTTIRAAGPNPATDSSPSSRTSPQGHP